MTRSQAQADETSRVRLGSTARTAPELLQDLATDPSVTVRAALALNAAAPLQANRLLARDRDERVRALLARRLAGLLPTLDDDAQANLQRETFGLLTTLVADEAVRVRAAIADVVKEMPSAPHDIILRLAQDEDVMVCESVIRLSPQLTAEDLLSLIALAPATALTVAGRAAINERVSDAIASTMDSAAIRALLCNHSAQIREATLDALVARAIDHVEWHEPMVRRPKLSPRAARTLAEIVATNLLEELAAREDLEPGLTSELRTRLTARLSQVTPAPKRSDSTVQEAMVEARTLERAGELTEEKLLEAARNGDARLAAALLAVAAGTSLSVVDRAASLRSAKGMVSLVWKAGFTMRAATAVQTLLARLTPAAVLSAGPGDSFPLAVEEMRWQLDFLGRKGR